jgi:hypothetical protein
MKIFVVFDFPEIKDANSEEATFEIDSLSEDVNGLGYNWYIDEVIGEEDKG